MQTAERLRFSAEDYLAWEETQAEKHEFVAGEVFAMTGARQAHVLVSGNIHSALKQRLRGTPCRAYMVDMKLRVESADAFFIPTSWFPVIPMIVKQNNILQIQA
nr:Uma2 family endonuclease [Methylomonas koyamae]